MTVTSGPEAKSRGGNGAAVERGTRETASPLGLRAFHVLIFLGFAAATIAGMLPELKQLLSGLLHAWHPGTPPSPLGTAAALAALGLSIALIAFLALGRSAPLWMSVAMLAAFGISIWQQSYPFERRSAPGANLAMFELGKKLHEKMRQQLQDTGAVANTQDAWRAALDAVATDTPSPFHTRFFGTVPWTLRTLATEGDFLTDAPPGTFTVFIPADASRFTITMIGLDPEHQPVRLRDDHNQPFELKGAYTPDTRR